MSDNKQNYRRAKPIYMGLRRKLDGNIQNLVNDNDRKFGKQAEKAFVPFVQQRYNMYRDFTRTKNADGDFEYNPRITELLGNHVYGDYRLNMVDGNAQYQFIHRTAPYAIPLGISIAPPVMGGLGPRPLASTVDISPALQMLERGISNSAGLSGLMGSGVNADGVFVPTASELFERIINERDPASIFFLPSVGTAIMSFASLTKEWPTALTQYLAGHQSDLKKQGRIPELFFRLLVNTDSDDDRKLELGDSDLGAAPWFTMVERGSDSPEFMTIANLAYDGRDAPGFVTGEEVRLFFVLWAHSIINSPDFSRIPDSDLIAKKIARLAIQATFNARNYDITEDEANEYGFESGPGGNIPNKAEYDNKGMNFRGATITFLALTDEEILMESSSSSDTLKGTVVRLRDDILDADGKFPDYVSGDPPKDEWQEHGGFFPAEGSYAWEVDGEWTITDGKDEENVTVQQVGYPLIADDEDNIIGIDTDEEELYELSGLKSADYIAIEEEERDGDDGLDFSAEYDATITVLARIMLDAYFEMESHLALVLNSTKISFNRYSKEYNKSDDGILQYKQPLTDKDVQAEDFYTTRGKNKTPVADFLAQERSTIMGSLAASFLALAGDSNYKQLFEGDLNLREVKWYSDFIATRLLQARPIEEQRSALAELRAEPVPGSVPSFQLVTPQTVIRKLDVPTLRLIMSRYFTHFYTDLANKAKELDSRPLSKNQKKKKLNEQMWDTVEATVVTMLSLEGINPAEFWRQTFGAVSNARTASGDNSRLVLPPSWAGSVFRADLERDAFLTGKAPDIPKNVTLFRSYIGFLRTTYTQDYALIGNLLGAFQSTAAKQIEDITELQDFFSTRLQNDEKFRLRGESVPAYRMFIYICREILSIPDYILAADMAMASPPPAFAAPDTSELEGGIMMGAEPTEFASPSTPTLGPTGFPVLSNPSILRPDRRA